MVAGWRRAFCTSIPKDRESKVLTEKQQHCDNNTNPSPKISSKFAFFSNPSTPRSQSQLVNSSGLRPKLQCTNAKTPKKQNSPRLLQLSNPSSPKSPSSFSLLKASLRLSKNRCGICLQSVKTGQGTAIFTAECSHTFHFPCIAAHVTKQPILICPVCNTNWKELPVLAIYNDKHDKKGDIKTRPLKVYNDDEPLRSPTSVARFNPIPESDENEEDQEEESTEFQGFNVNPVGPLLLSPRIRTLEVCLLPEAAIVAANRSYETYVVVLKVQAPPSNAVARRAPIDLVTVLDVGGTMAGQKLQMMKRSMRLVISSLGSTDRLSIVAFSSGSKRILPLRRMTSSGQRSARRIVDALTVINQTREEASVTNDALKKAAKVIEDRREKNPFASVMLLSFSHLEIPVHSVRFQDGGACAHAQPDHAFAKCVGGLLNVVAQDLKLQLGIVSRSAPVEIAAVYSLSGRPTALGSGNVRLGDLYAEEERELLVELKVPAASAGSHHVLSVRSSYRDPSSEELVYSKDQALLIPRPHTVRSSDPKIERLRNLHVTARAVAESRRLAEHNDLSGAHYLLSSARALVLQSSPKSGDEYLRWLEAEQAELQRRRQQQLQSLRQRGVTRTEEKVEPNTPTSAWRAAERLAKVAIMRKSMNRVSDLHGFENARF
ncbi:putative E3 ubiquitin-protein ligase EDA40 [Senna tora]|uniref:Putative E3 ubiquitin-protein ligase EDA40 n=1 Tax=Senna tora TaxID=362788 RepID=A0A834TZM9_9FABA|nr:putative E3 ubiquitin-protein ligase EDA40 [Senna tora]